MQASLSLLRRLGLVLVLLCAVLAVPASAQQRARMAADLVAEAPPVPGETMTVALRFRPREGWHGYWSNPGEAGLGMTLDWSLPQGWQAGEPVYPVPDLLFLFGIANHAYERDYTVLVPIDVPASAAVANPAPVTVAGQWLVCSDELCVPERATLTLRYPQATPATRTQFDADRAAIPPQLESPARLALTERALRLAIPLPASMDLGTPHVFVAERDLVDYGAAQTFSRQGDWLVAEIARGGLRHEAGAVSGILSFGEGRGVRFAAVPGDVPTGGEPVGPRGIDAPLALLLGGALLGGLLLNLMPCVFPILSLKALSLARAGESEARARAEGVAYGAGVILACLLLGAIMLLLRAGGEQVGWAFQLQQPLVVAALLVLAILITANLAGLFDLPMVVIRRDGRTGAFATGLLAAVVATPCTGPFMAAAMGAALVLPWAQAMLLFLALGVGLALPFLLLGFVPPLRALLPRPGAWMERFRRWMALPMGLTALALVWLAWRLGGAHFAFAAFALALALIAAFVSWTRGGRAVAAIAAAVAIYFAVSLPLRIEAPSAAEASESLLDPIPFSSAALSEQRAAGRPVFVWFTADWCVTCKVNERVAIERESTRAAFARAGVVAMRGDWTRGDPAITRFLEAQGVAGVPLYLFYPAGGEGVQLPQVLTAGELESLAAEAR